MHFVKTRQDLPKPNVFTTFAIEKYRPSQYNILIYPQLFLICTAQTKREKKENPVMQLMEERILRDGVVRAGNVLKVDSFLNHQMDIDLFNEMGK